MKSHIIEKDATWCDVRRIGKDYVEEDFMDNYVMPPTWACVTTPTGSYDESWANVRKIIMPVHVAAHLASAPQNKSATIAYVAMRPSQSYYTLA
jgi:hypothetical protein